MAANDFTIKKITPKLGGERGTRKGNGPTSSHDLVEQMEFLYVEIIRVVKYDTIVNPPGFPMVELSLGNCKASTENLPLGPQMYWKNPAYFAFDKTKGDVLSVVLSVFIRDGFGKVTNKIRIGKRDFKLASDIPSRTPPDARLAAKFITMHDPETGYSMELSMSVWFGTQMDEVYSQAWFSDAYEVSASCVINTRPKLYIAPRLSYARVTIVSGEDLLPSDRKRNPSVYVKATIGTFSLKSRVSSGRDPSWNNQDLIFVVSEPFEETLFIELIDQVDEQHEECIARLTKKLSEFTTLKIPGSASPVSYDLETPVKVEPRGDTRRFASRIKMKLAIDQAYHVAEECIQYASDYRAFAKGLWPGVLGKLEIGILGATGLKGRDDKKTGIDSYVVAKYGNRWARTRTVVDNSSPKWNEQYSWDVYDMSTVVTIGVYDNRQILSGNNNANDVLIGKVRIPLNRVHWNCIYTNSFPVMVLGSSGLKKTGELQLAFRCVCLAKLYDRIKAPFLLMHPKAHYKSPLSAAQIDQLRAQAVEVNCMNLARTEPPLRNEVVMDMLKPKSKNFSMRIIQVNYQRLNEIALKLISPFTLFNTKIVETTDWQPKFSACVLCFCLLYCMWLLLAVAWFVVPLYIFFQLTIPGLYKLWRIKRLVLPPPPLIINDLKLWHLDSPKIDDELDEEFDSFPTSLIERSIISMRYDRLRNIAARLMLFMGNVASQGERVLAILALFENMHPVVSFCVCIVCALILWIIYQLWYIGWLYKCIYLLVFGLWLQFPCFRNNLPTGLKNCFRRLPTNEELF